MINEENKELKRTRRGNREGSIFQRKNGRWVGTATIGHTEDGKLIRKNVYGRTRMEVSDKLTKLTKRIDSDYFEQLKTNTIGQVMNEWLLVFKKSQVSPRTFEGNLTKFKRHIEPRIGNMQIEELTPIVIQKMLNDMLEEQLSLDYIKKTKFLIGQFFEYAVDNNIIQSNPINKVKVKSKEKKIYDNENKYKAIPPEVREKFINALDNHAFLKPFCFTMMFAGLRSGEALALTWEDINFDERTINVSRSITIVPKFDKDGNITKRTTVLSDTKTACSIRSVPMPDILLDTLGYYKQFKTILANQYKSNLVSKNSFVFGNNDGTIRTYGGTKKIFYRFLEKHNLKNLGIHFHTLRHTYSNILFEANQNPKVIQALLGHKSVNTTLTTYNSVDKSYFKKATDVFNKQFDCRFTTTKKEADYTNHKIDVNDFSNFEDSEEIGIFPTTNIEEQKQPENRKENKQEIDYSNLSDKEFDDKIYELIKMRELQKYKQKLGL